MNNKQKIPYLINLLVQYQLCYYSQLATILGMRTILLVSRI